MVVLPKRSIGVSKSLYSPLGLKDLPFPTEPVVDPYNNDPRRNGAIYAESPVKREIEKFEQLLIRPNDFPNRVRLSYLWSKGDRESGRGMGKTALLRYFRQRINRDWGQTEFNGQFSAVVVYVAFPSQVDRRYMEQLAWSALVDICKNGVLNDSRAVLRLEALTPEQGDLVLQCPDGSHNPDNLLDDSILQAHGIEITALDKRVAERLTSEGVQPQVSLSLAQGQFREYLCSLRKDGNLEPFYIPRHTKNLDYSRTLLFNDIVHYLRAAGFAGGYLFIDDIENLVDQMTRKDRIEFAKEFCLCTMRPGYANTAYNFFSCVLTTHQQASIGLAQAWGEAGLSTIARLDPNSPNSVELPLPSEDQAREIIIAHLDYHRTNELDKGTVKPFTEDGISALLKRSQHPRDLLSNAAKVILHAIDKKITDVDKTVVNEAMDNSAPPSIPDFSEGIDGAL
ncbi:MAG: hypothetical protein AB1611_13720 [bacterium]